MLHSSLRQGFFKTQNTEGGLSRPSTCTKEQQTNKVITSSLVKEDMLEILFLLLRWKIEYMTIGCIFAESSHNGNDNILVAMIKWHTQNLEALEKSMALHLHGEMYDFVA